jgi:CRP/FNR family cyclic AMP-dependent transcriptional regulator
LAASGTPVEPVVIDTIGAGDLLGWSWMFPPHAWHFTARATKPTVAIYFQGRILREYCERDHALGYELFKRMSAVMVKRLQAARLKMAAIDSQRMALPPAIVQSPFTDQELDSVRAAQA